MRRANLGKSETIAVEFLRALRGTRTQRAFARRLGYRANPITDWEHGRRYPSAKETLRAARLFGVDVHEAFRAFHPAPPPAEAASGFVLAPWLDSIRGATSLVDLARRCGSSRFAVARWLRGEAHPRLPEFFRVVDAATGRLPDLVARLVPIEEVPSLERRYRSMEAARRVAYDAPWTEAVLRVLESEPYRALPSHRRGFISQRLEISLEQEQACLALLRQAGVVSYRGRRYRVVDTDAVDTRGDRDRVTALLRHWADVAQRQIETREPDELFAYNVFCISARDWEQVRARLQHAFREIRSLVATSSPAERVALVNLQLVRLDHDSVESKGDS